MSSNTKYDDSAISQLKGADRVRFRPEALLGSKGIDGARHTVYEIIGNATDEHLSGFGNDIEVGYYEDGSVSVRDFGRGVPLGWNEKEQAWNYHLIYEELYAGGKYNDSQEVLWDYENRNAWDEFKLEEHPYLITVGLNGLGAAATQCTSEFCTVSSFRDHVKRTMEYEKGNHVLDELREENTDEENGTFVHWKPDSKVFTDVKLGSKWLNKVCESLSYTTNFNVRFNNKGVVKEYPNSSLEEQMNMATGVCLMGSKFHHEILDGNKIGVCFVDVAIGSSGRGTEFFHNKVGINGGVHSEAVSSALALFFEDRSKEKSIRIKNIDYSGKFSFIVSSLSNIVSYRGQTKDSLDDFYVFRAIYSAIKDALDLAWDKGVDWLLDLVEEVVVNAENRLAVAELSKNIREMEKTVKSAKVSQKFKSCEAYDNKEYDKVEFWIFEGNSAGNSGKNARNSEYQCILPVRGKSLNVYKAPVNQIINNAEIKDIAAVLGCGVDMGIDGVETFDINKIKVGKIIIGADADIDGLHIRMLIVLILFKLFPEVLYNGMVYLANTPKFTIIKNNDEHVFCTSDEDFLKKREQIGVLNIKDIVRFKGLGEMNADQLWDTTMNPQTRSLTQVKIDRNDENIYDTLEVLFGKSTERRKRAILGDIMGSAFDDSMDNIEEMIEYVNNLDLGSDIEYEEVTI